MEQKIIAYARAAQNDDGKTRWLKIGEVGAVDKILASTGVDLAGYSHILDASKIKHVMLRHGNDATERKNNQRGITAADFSKVASIVDEHDNVSLSQKTSNGNLKALIFVKQIGNEKFYYVTEVRAGRKQLAPATLYVKI